jgi:hypothetical protein
VNLVDRLRAKVRYYSAFERGRLPEERFARRIEALQQGLADRRARKTALEESEAIRPELPTGLVIRETAEAIAEAMTSGHPPTTASAPSAARRRRRGQ